MVGRYAIRYVNLRQFLWDDLVHLFALVVLIAHGGTNQLSLNSKAAIAKAADSKPRPSQSYLLGLYEHNQRLSSVNNCFLYLVFWIVKLSFLMLYRFLFQSSRPFKKAWWVVLAFTALTFWIPVAGVLSTCAGADTVANYSQYLSNSSLISPLPLYRRLMRYYQRALRWANSWTGDQTGVQLCCEHCIRLGK